MDIKETLKLHGADSTLLSDSAYYKYIFKKTEKIVCVVFYILENIDKSQYGTVSAALEQSAKKTLDAVIASLSVRRQNTHRELHVFVNSLLALESHIRLAQAVSLLEAGSADMIALEIQSVLKGIRPYVVRQNSGIAELAENQIDSLDALSPGTPARSGKSLIPSYLSMQKGEASPRAQNESKGHDSSRQQTIKDILRTHGEATIKDISVSITDCSEKTIQRELISMIKDGLVRKEGERRWSRYSLV